MRHLLAGLLALTFFTAVGCGGDDKDSCGDFGVKLEACEIAPAEDGETWCEEVVCDDKRALIDCLMDASCPELEDAPVSCLDAGGCELVKTEAE